MHLQKTTVQLLFRTVLCISYCMEEPIRIFHLIKSCQRSNQKIIGLENVISLPECSEFSEQTRALSFNYSPFRSAKMNYFAAHQGTLDSKTTFPKRMNRRHFFDQPEEYFNCHALECPESPEFKTMVNDSRFNYYSLYGDPPEIGIFQLMHAAEKYSTAYRVCKTTLKGTLAHIVSEARTEALSKLLQGPEYINGSLKLAHVGLNYSATIGNEFKTSENEDLSCFLYRAWAPGHPKRGKWFSNSSCVALTTDASWMTVECDRKLPYICEIDRSPLNDTLYENSCLKYLNFN